MKKPMRRKKMKPSMGAKTTKTAKPRPAAASSKKQTTRVIYNGGRVIY